MQHLFSAALNVWKSKLCKHASILSPKCTNQNWKWKRNLDKLFKSSLFECLLFSLRISILVSHFFSNPYHLHKENLEFFCAWKKIWKSCLLILHFMYRLLIFVIANWFSSYTFTNSSQFLFFCYLVSHYFLLLSISIA